MFGFLPGPCGCAGADAHGAWQSHFCGLCNTLRRRYGLWSRWLINRDSTFLALAGSALAPAPPPVTLTTCCNPLGRKKPLVQHEAHLRYAAAVTICALTVKLSDDAADERGLRRAGARAGSWLLRRARAKAMTDLEALHFPAASVARGIGGQSLVESSGAGLAAAATPVAEAYGAIFGHLPAVSGGNPAAAEPLTRVGAALGRMIYTMDAWEDYEADHRRQRFNPLPSGATERRDLVLAALCQDLESLRHALANLPLLRFSGLLMALTGPRLEQRTLARLGMSGPPPLPPEVPDYSAPPPPEWRDETRRKHRPKFTTPRMRCRDRCSGCCGCNSGRNASNADAVCCECCASGCDCGSCECGACDCGACDCSCG